MDWEISELKQKVNNLGYDKFIVDTVVSILNKQVSGQKLSISEQGIVEALEDIDIIICSE
jgi:hypothetical protein